MSANTWNTQDLINDVLLYAHIPAANNTLSPANIMRLGTYEIQTPITKQILATRGGYYLTYQDYTVASTGLYFLPSDAISGVLANVEMVQGPTIIPVNQIVESEQFSTISPTSMSYGFFLRGNYVQILPIPNLGTVRLWYFKRTSNLVLTSAAGQIQSIDSVNFILSLTNIPATFTVGTLIDFCGDQPPFNYFGTQTITAISGSDITFDGLPQGISLGDWTALQGQTPVPQIPVEYRMVLVQRIICKFYELQGYLDKLKSAKELLKEYEANAMNLITTRVKSQTKIINPVNGGFSSARNRFSNFPAGKIP